MRSFAADQVEGQEPGADLAGQAKRDGKVARRRQVAAEAGKPDLPVPAFVQQDVEGGAVPAGEMLQHAAGGAVPGDRLAHIAGSGEIGRASCRERVWQYV